MNKNKYEEKLINKFESKLDLDNKFAEIISKVDSTKYINPTKSKFKFPIFAIIYTLLIISITIPLTLSINSYFSNNEVNGDSSQPEEENNNFIVGDINPRKDKNIVNDYFDEFFAFGSDSPTSLYSIDVLLNSNVLSEKNKTILSQSENSMTSYYNLYFGIKEGVDRVILTQLSDPYEILIFQSNFDYSFSECINEFEQMSGQEITQDYLKSSNFDNTLKKETNGVIIHFKSTDNRHYAYYTININDNLYVLNK